VLPRGFRNVLKGELRRLFILAAVNFRAERTFGVMGGGEPRGACTH